MNLGLGTSCWKVDSYLPMPGGLECRILTSKYTLVPPITTRSNMTLAVEHNVKQTINLNLPDCPVYLVRSIFAPLHLINLFSSRVRNLKFARNLIFATSKTLVHFMKKMIFCLKFGIFQFKKPKFTVYLTNLTSISLLYPQTKVGDILDSGPSRRRRRRRRRRNFLVDAITQKQINIFFQTWYTC